MNGDLPVHVGGGGERRTLRIAARYADEWNTWGGPDVLRQKGGVLDAHCDRQGRDAGEIVRSAQCLLFLSEDTAWLDKYLKHDAGADRRLLATRFRYLEPVDVGVWKPVTLHRADRLSFYFCSGYDVGTASGRQQNDDIAGVGCR